MTNYLIRRIFYIIPILIGVNFLTFALFFIANSPEDIARSHLGDKYISSESVQNWLENKGYNKPLFINNKESGSRILTNTIFFQKSVKLFVFDFGNSDDGRNIKLDILERMWPSLYLAVPTFILGLIVNISVALMIVLFKNTKIDTYTTIILIALMSISYLFYILFAQFLFSKKLLLVPASGFIYGFQSWRFLVLPVFIGIISGIGTGARWYRAILLDVSHQDFIITAKAKGVSEIKILYKHILPNALLPILTGIVIVIPFLIMGSVLMESFFSIPGLGNYLLDAINGQDFSIVRAIVFLSSILYILGLFLTDIFYAWADPRIKLS